MTRQCIVGHNGGGGSREEAYPAWNKEIPTPWVYLPSRSLEKIGVGPGKGGGEQGKGEELQEYGKTQKGWHILEHLGGCILSNAELTPCLILCGSGFSWEQVMCLEL